MSTPLLRQLISAGLNSKTHYEALAHTLTDVVKAADVDLRSQTSSQVQHTLAPLSGRNNWHAVAARAAPRPTPYPDLPPAALAPLYHSIHQAVQNRNTDLRVLSPWKTMHILANALVGADWPTLVREIQAGALAAEAQLEIDVAQLSEMAVNSRWDRVLEVDQARLTAWLNYLCEEDPTFEIDEFAEEWEYWTNQTTPKSLPRNWFSGQSDNVILSTLQESMYGGDKGKFESDYKAWMAHRVRDGYGFQFQESHDPDVCYSPATRQEDVHTIRAKCRKIANQARRFRNDILKSNFRVTEYHLVAREAPSANPLVHPWYGDAHLYGGSIPYPTEAQRKGRPVNIVEHLDASTLLAADQPQKSFPDRLQRAWDAVSERFYAGGEPDLLQSAFVGGFSLDALLAGNELFLHLGGLEDPWGHHLDRLTD